MMNRIADKFIEDCRRTVGEAREIEAAAARRAANRDVRLAIWLVCLTNLVAAAVVVIAVLSR